MATTKRAILARVAAGVALVLAGAACGGGDDAGSGGAPATVSSDGTMPDLTGVPTDDPEEEAPTDAIDACSLLTGVDLDVLLGEPAGEPSGSGSSCRVDPVDADSAGSIQVEVSTPGGAENYEQQKEFLGEGEAIEGLGDEAFLSGTFLNVLVGDTRVLLAPVNHPLLPADARVEPAEIEAAMATILENLAAS